MDKFNSNGIGMIDSRKLQAMTVTKTTDTLI